MAIYELFFDDFLYINEVIVQSPKIGQLTQTWAVDQRVATNRKSARVQQPFNIYQTINVRTSIKNLSVLQSIPFYQQGAPTEFQTVTQFFHMWQEARAVEYEQISQTLVINQSINVTKAKNVSHTLVFNQTITYSGVWNRTITDSYVVNSAASAYTGDKYGSAIALPTLTGPNAPGC